MSINLKSKKIYHYTTLDSLKKILRSKSLKFNRNDKLNDLVEESRIVDLNEKYFVSCFTYEENESIPLWHIYGSKKNGIRISVNCDELFSDRIYFYHNNEKKSFEKYSYIVPHNKKKVTQFNYKIIPQQTVVLSDIEAIEVEYSNKMIAEKPYVVDKYDNMTVTSYKKEEVVGFKPESWNYEKEIRFYTMMKYDFLKIDSIFVELNDKFLENLEITINPFATNDEKEFIIWELNSLFPEIDFKFMKSELDELIRI